MEQSNLPTVVKVLLVDDDEEDYLIIKHLFNSMKSIENQLEWVSSSEEAIEKIKESRHDAYLIDYRLDARTGLDVLREVNAHERSEPFILLTGVGDQGIERKSLALAASDYLVKSGLTSESLAKALYYALGRKEQEKQKIEQLLEVNKAKDEFISIASHQLRTPVTTVKQYTAMVLEGLAGELNEKQRAFLEKAYESNERQLTIINGLLKVAQIDAGGMELALKETDLRQLVEEAVEDFRPSFEQAGQQLEITTIQNVVANVDENALRMVIDNLLENAKKYSDAQSVTRVSITHNTQELEIVISDEGVGVEQPERLFQKFSRIANKLSNEVGGTGLGLYWAQSITRLHGGDLTYENNTPIGSKFIVKLPVL
jgi:two-component system, sensor histidine kinase and response regulator